ncbi:protein-disulfide reductase DsbD domain-containing protein [Palleronia aestuarii]|nr:protein-disulfide reductase DsbD domain-containing protein [Palleronia aestuarii]
MSSISRLLGLCLVLAAPAAAQQEIASLDLLPGWREDGTHVAGLKIDLEPGWKTYWRAPGEAGLPPRFDWSQSSNVASVAVRWPVPEIFGMGGLTSVGYSETVTLPLVVTPRDPTRPAELSLDLEMGVCETICVPVSRHLSTTLGAEPVRADARIRAALADRPLSEEEAQVRHVTCQLLPGSGDPVLEARIDMPPVGGDEYTVIELPDPSLWVSQARTSREGDALVARATLGAPRGVPVGIDREALRMTVIGDTGAVDIHGCD